MYLTTEFFLKNCRITINLSQDNNIPRNIFGKGSLLLVPLFNKGEYPSKLENFRNLLKTFNHLNVICYNRCFLSNNCHNFLLLTKLPSCPSKINNIEHTHTLTETTNKKQMNSRAKGMIPWHTKNSPRT